MYDLEFRNLTSEPSAENDGYEILQRVCELAPYGSRCQGTVEPLEAGYLATFDIRSQVGLFNAKGNGLTVESALAEAEADLLNQLSEWRKKRFRDQLKDTYNSVA